MLLQAKQAELIVSPFVLLRCLQDYLTKGGKWLHIDMAGPAFAEDRATGYGVALLSQMVKKLN
jgi:leucyl aminopeptidase